MLARHLRLIAWMMLLLSVGVLSLADDTADQAAEPISEAVELTEEVSQQLFGEGLAEPMNGKNLPPDVVPLVDPEAFPDFIKALVTPTAFSNPNARVVGTLVRKNGQGNYQVVSGVDFLKEAPCQATIKVDVSKNAVHRRIFKEDDEIKIDLIVVKFTLGTSKAAEVTVTRTALIEPTKGLDFDKIKAKELKDAGEDLSQYAVVWTQQIYTVELHIFEKSNLRGAGSHSGIAIDGNFYKSFDQKDREYFFNLDLVPLDSVR